MTVDNMQDEHFPFNLPWERNKPKSNNLPGLPTHWDEPSWDEKIAQLQNQLQHKTIYNHTFQHYPNLLKRQDNIQYAEKEYGKEDAFSSLKNGKGFYGPEEAVFLNPQINGSLLSNSLHAKTAIPDFSNFVQKQAFNNHFKRNEQMQSSLPHELGQHRMTPEILEPRKAIYEEESSLKKKVRPVKQNGVVAELPSINTFCNVTLKSLTSEKGPNKRKNKFAFKESKVRKKVAKVVQSSCGCPVDDHSGSGPFYTHLGSGRTLEELKSTLKNQLVVEEHNIKLHLVKYTSTEGKNGDGCPLARWVLRRTGPEEKYLVIAKHNIGHICDGTFSIIALVAWEGISQNYANGMYQYLTDNLNKGGFSTRRRCGANDSKTCMCQGDDESTNGASFSFGCSWSIFFNGCKFAKSKAARKFKMQEQEKESEIETVLQDMATNVSPLLNVWAPRAFKNMTNFENVGSDCRIGKNLGGRPFSGVTCCLDFCAHSHKDMHNMLNGTTMVCTLLKPDYDERDDEQLHVLPLYQLLDSNGGVAPPNFNIPKHFMNSKIQTKQEPKEGKGKYVMPSKVNKKKEKSEESNMENDIFRPVEPQLKFQEEKNIASVMSTKSWPKINELNVNTATTTNASSTTSFFPFNFNVPSMNPTFINDSSIPNMSLTNHPLFNDIRPDAFFQQQKDCAKLKEEMALNGSIDNFERNIPSEQKAFYPSKPTSITSDMGGVAIALGHGSFLVECAKKELHATTALRNPKRNDPTRISMVFYQHKKLNKSRHGFFEHQEKMKEREELKKQKQCFDDLALLANTASLDDSFITLDTSCENTPEKQKSFLDTYKFDNLSRSHSNSEPNLPSLFDQNTQPYPLSLSTRDNFSASQDSHSVQHIMDSSTSQTAFTNQQIKDVSGVVAQQIISSQDNFVSQHTINSMPHFGQFDINTIMNDSTLANKNNSSATKQEEKLNGTRSERQNPMSLLPTINIFARNNESVIKEPLNVKTEPSISNNNKSYQHQSPLSSAVKTTMKSESANQGIPLNATNFSSSHKNVLQHVNKFDQYNMSEQPFSISNISGTTDHKELHSTPDELNHERSFAMKSPSSVLNNHKIPPSYSSVIKYSPKSIKNSLSLHGNGINENSCIKKTKTLQSKNNCQGESSYNTLQGLHTNIRLPEHSNKTITQPVLKALHPRNQLLKAVADKKSLEQTPIAKVKSSTHQINTNTLSSRKEISLKEISQKETSKEENLLPKPFGNKKHVNPLSQLSSMNSSDHDLFTFHSKFMEHVNARRHAVDNIPEHSNIGNNPNYLREHPTYNQNITKLSQHPPDHRQNRQIQNNFSSRNFSHGGYLPPHHSVNRMIGDQFASQWQPDPLQQFSIQPHTPTANQFTNQHSTPYTPFNFQNNIQNSRSSYNQNNSSWDGFVAKQHQQANINQRQPTLLDHHAAMWNRYDTTNYKNQNVDMNQFFKP